jgi:hypothetical protein
MKCNPARTRKVRTLRRQTGSRDLGICINILSLGNLRPSPRVSLLNRSMFPGKAFC